MIFEALDKACDICRDYLVAPTVTASAPAADVFPQPWSEIVVAGAFAVLCLSIKGFHKRHHEHKLLQKAAEHGESVAMIAGDLRKGDVFVECSAEEWDDMSKAKRLKVKRVAVLGLMPECRHDRTRVHLHTSAGDWCIPRVAPVVLTPVERIAPKRIIPAPAKSRVLVS